MPSIPWRFHSDADLDSDPLECNGCLKRWACTVVQKVRVSVVAVQGRKMSKSLGNVIDPLDTIGEYGTDALRFTLATGTTPGQVSIRTWTHHLAALHLLRPIPKTPNPKPKTLSPKL